MQGRGLVGLTEIESASRRLAGIVVPTPLIPADAISEAVDARVRLKCENLQRAGSFKIRGAYNFVSQLSDDQVANGIITYSSGNHAQAVALASKMLGIKALIVMLNNSVKHKLEQTKAYGAEVILGGDTSEAIKERAEQVNALLRRGDLATFLVVSSATEETIREAIFFHEQLGLRVEVRDLVFSDRKFETAGGVTTDIRNIVLLFLGASFMF